MSQPYLNGRKASRGQKNCKLLRVTKVQSEIWNIAQKTTRGMDARLQKVQESLVKGIIPIARLMGATGEVTEKEGAMPSPDELWKGLSNSVLLVASAKHNLNMCRRDLFKLDLDDTYKAICSSKQPVGLELFGDDLTDRLKTVKESKKTAKQVTCHKRKDTEEYSRSSYSARGSFSLHRRGGSLPGTLAKKKQLPGKSQRQPEREQHLQGEDLCDTEVTPEGASPILLLSVIGVVAGRIQHFVGKWKQLTLDPSILNAVRGSKIAFLLTPVQFTIPITVNFVEQESSNVDAEIFKFSVKETIVKSSHEEGYVQVCTQ